MDRVGRLGRRGVCSNSRAANLWPFLAVSGLAGNLIESLLTDREGRAVGGHRHGLNRLRRKSLFTLSQSEGLGFGAAQGLAEVTPGVLWVGKPNGGLYRWDGKSFSRLSAAGLSAS